MCRTALFVSVEEHLTAYYMCKEAVTWFNFLLSPHGLKGAINFVQKWISRWPAQLRGRVKLFYFRGSWFQEVEEPNFSLTINMSKWLLSSLLHHYQTPPPSQSSLSYCHVSQWPKTRVWIGNWIYWILTGLTTINYYTIAALHNVKSLHINLFSLSALVFTGL
jgi:hypothetical protein